MALHRPYIRKSVREEVENRAQKNENGQFLDANTGRPIEGKYDIGHKTGHEYRTALAEAEKQGLSQSNFNDLQNNPDILQIEDPSSNRSHTYEKMDEAEAVNEEVSERSESEAIGISEGIEMDEAEVVNEEVSESESEATGISEGIEMDV